MRAFVAWQSDEKEDRDYQDFAEYLDIPAPTFYKYKDGKSRPPRENADKIAAKLGPEIYDVCGYPRPNPLKQKIEEVFDQLPEVEQYKVLEFTYERLRESREEGYASSAAQGNAQPDARPA